jgi:hypothetical protein
MIPRVYFYSCPEPYNLQDDIVILAEGLQALGIPFFASADYWLQSTTSGDYLIKATPDVTPDDCDIVVIPYTWFNWVRLDHPTVRRDFPAGLFKPGRRYRTVYMDTNDGLRTVSWEPAFRQFDFIFRTKLNRRVWAPDNLHPWVLGLSNRMVRMTADAPSFASRRPAVLVNFGASHHYPHTARERADLVFSPVLNTWLQPDTTRDDLSTPPADAYDRLMWEQTNHRHSRSYYDRLKNTQACACFCGDLIPPAPWRNPGQYLVGGNKAALKLRFWKTAALFDPRPERIVQWDSWRFWEAISAGCLAFNLDLDLYGAHLPVMPVKDVHYLGVDLRRPHAIRERWQDDPAGLARIASAGRSWAFENYSPAPMAARFLRSLGFAPTSVSSPHAAAPSAS